MIQKTLKSELLYMWWALVLWQGGLLFYHSASALRGKDVAAVLPFLPLMFSAFYNIRKSEKRERFLALLPLSRVGAAWVRLGILVIPFLMMFVLIQITIWIAPALGPMNVDLLLGFMSGLLLVMSIFFIIHDRIDSRKAGELSVSIAVVAGALGLAFILFMVYQGMQGDSSIFNKIWHSVSGSAFVQNGWLERLFIVIGVGMTLVTIYTYNRRSTFTG